MQGVTTPALSVADFNPGLTVRGDKSRTNLVIDSLPDGQPLSFPVLVVRGAEEGRKLLATGVIHGDEFEGAVAIHDLFDELDPVRMRGTFIGVPVVNGPAFTAGVRRGSFDHQDLARVFPGNSDGSPSERVAHALAEHLIPQADLYADLHSGGNAYRVKPFAGYQIRCKLFSIQREAAVAFGLDLVWGTVGLEGEGRSRQQSCALAAQCLRNLLAYLGIVAGDYPAVPPPYLIEDERAGSGNLRLDNHAPASGLFLPDVDVWDRVDVGDRLGVVRLADGRLAAEVRSTKAGRVLLLRTFPRVVVGDSVIYIIEIDEDK